MSHGSHTGVLGKLRHRAGQLKSESYALYLAARDPRTPWYVGLLVAGIVAYALSPIDLIPDFVPVVGYLDDLILLPLLIGLAVKMTPAAILRDCRARAQTELSDKRPASRAGAVLVASFWSIGAGMLVWWLFF